MQKNLFSSQAKHQRIISVQLAFFLIQRYCWTNSSSLYFSPICVWESKHSCNSPDSPIQNLSQLPLHVHKTGCQESFSICSLFSWSTQCFMFTWTKLQPWKSKCRAWPEVTMDGVTCYKVCSYWRGELTIFLLLQKKALEQSKSRKRKKKRKSLTCSQIWKTIKLDKLSKHFFPPLLSYTKVLVLLFK